MADVATSRKRLELQLNQLQQQSAKYEDQGRKALALGREDLAREALSRRAALQQQVTDLETQHQTLQGEEEKLTLAAQRLQAKVDAFRTKKETIKATYSAAKAQTQIGEAFSGISEEMGDVGLAIQRAEDKTEQLRAARARWTSCWPPAPWTTRPASPRTTSRPSSTGCPAAVTWSWNCSA